MKNIVYLYCWLFILKFIKAPIDLLQYPYHTYTVLNSI